MKYYSTITCIFILLSLALQCKNPESASDQYLPVNSSATLVGKWQLVRKELWVQGASIPDSTKEFNESFPEFLDTFSVDTIYMLDFDDDTSCYNERKVAYSISNAKIFVESNYAADAEMNGSSLRIAYPIDTVSEVHYLKRVDGLLPLSICDLPSHPQPQ